MPNYNGSALLAESIRSVLAQTYREWELLLVDDRSTDDSVAVAKEAAGGDERVSVLRNDREAKGGSVCRNIGLRQATGEFLIFMDSDDLLEPECLAGRVELMEREQLDAAVFAMRNFRQSIGDEDSYWRPVKQGALDGFLSHRIPWQTMCPIWRREFVLRQDGFNEAYPRLQDVEFHTRCLLDEELNFEVYPDVVDCHYRLPATSAGTSVAKLKPTIEGFRLYLDEFSRKAEKRNGRTLLFLSLFSAIERICRAYRERSIDRQALAEYSDQLLRGRLCQAGGFWRTGVIRAYRWLFGYLSLPARGINRVMRWLLC